MEALELAMALDFVKDLEGGLDTDVGSIGNKLSGGQKQRIAIARALIAKPDIIIFDEATSALDGQNESKVQEAIDKISDQKNLTRIVISHKLSATHNADKTIVIKDGKISQKDSESMFVQKNKIESNFEQGKDKEDIYVPEIVEEEEKEERLMSFTEILTSLINTYEGSKLGMIVAIICIIIVSAGMPIR